MKPEPGREPIPEQAWSDLGAALRDWATALQARWRDPSFRIFKGYRSGSLTVSTQTADGATKTPVYGNPIRGAPGVSVKIEHRDAKEPEVADAMTEFPPSRLVGLEPSATEEAAALAQRSVRLVIKRHPELRRALMRVSWGPRAAETSDMREEEGTLSSDVGSCGTALSGLLAEALVRHGASATNLSSAVIPDECIEETLADAKESIAAQYHETEIVALLNCPAIDAREAVRVWAGQGYGAPCFMEIGYPSDQVCAQVLHGLGYQHIPRDSNLEHLNCLVRFGFALSTDLDWQERDAAVRKAEAYLRDMVDLLRVEFPGDVGILHVYGRSVERAGLIVPPFFGWFPEGPGEIPRTPLRRVYDPPPTGSLDQSHLARVGRMFQRHSIDRVPVPGLPAAMDRLRAIVERYEPGEPGRLLDAVTGLEALFLSGSKDELKYRLQLRIARFLETDPQKRVELAKGVKKMYDARSTLVHSGAPKKRGAIGDHERLAIRLLRAALKEFILTDFGAHRSSGQMGDVWLEFELNDKPRIRDEG